MEEILISLIVPVAISLFFCILNSSTKREEKKISCNCNLKISCAKSLIIFFLVWIIICIIFSIIVAILEIIDPVPTFSIFIAMELAIFGFAFLGLIGYVDSKKYIIVKDDKFIIKNGFRKSKEVKFDNIKYYDALLDNPYGGFTTYDQFGIPLFTISNYYVGVEQIHKLIKNLNISQLKKPYPSKEIKETIQYKTYKKISNNLICFWMFIACSIMMLLVLLIIVPLIKKPEYQKINICGVIEEFSYSDNTAVFILEDDENIYYVNNITYDCLKTELFNILLKGDTIEFISGYKDSKNRYNITNIEYQDSTYMKHNDAVQLENNNYKTGLIVCYIMFIILVISVIISIINIIKIQYYKKMENKIRYI